LKRTKPRCCKTAARCGANGGIAAAASKRSGRSKYYQQDHDLLAQVEDTDNEVSQRRVEQDKQQQLLRQILLQQEKLKILME
jgi:hypothetical protein